MFDTTVVAGPHIESGKVDRLHVDIGTILKEPEMQERIPKPGMQGVDMTTEQIANFQRGKLAKWAAVIKSANITLEESACKASGSSAHRD